MALPPHLICRDCNPPTCGLEVALLRCEASGRLIPVVPAGWSLLAAHEGLGGRLVALIGLGGLAVSGAGCVFQRPLGPRIRPFGGSAQGPPLAVSGGVGSAGRSARALACFGWPCC